MKTAVIQFGAGANKEANIQKALRLVEKASQKRAKFILLPEVFIYRGVCTPQKIKEIAERVNGPTVSRFTLLAKKYKTYILLGSIYEKTQHKKAYNTSVLIGPRGDIKARYRKKHLFDAKVGQCALNESDSFLKGSRCVVAKVGAFKVGLSICFDLRFPELYQKLVRLGADVLVVPSAFTKETGRVHWKTLLKARAIEHQCYVLAPNQTGRGGRGVTSYGHSMMIHPWGDVLAEASGSKTEIIYATLKKKEVSRVRKILNMKR